MAAIHGALKRGSTRQMDTQQQQTQHAVLRLPGPQACPSTQAVGLSPGDVLQAGLGPLLLGIRVHVYTCAMAARLHCRPCRHRKALSQGQRVRRCAWQQHATKSSNSIIQQRNTAATIAALRHNIGNHPTPGRSSLPFYQQRPTALEVPPQSWGQTLQHKHSLSRPHQYYLAY